MLKGKKVGEFMKKSKNVAIRVNPKQNLQEYMRKVIAASKEKDKKIGGMNYYRD